MRFNNDSAGLPRDRGINDRVVNREDFVALFADFLDTQNYGDSVHQAVHGYRNAEVDYISNNAFWADAMAEAQFDGRRVRLRDFTLLEWTPASPGRFYTGDAQRSRERAAEYLKWYGDDYEYLPLGKEYMVLGGVGSLRLGSRAYGRERVHVLGLSSTGVAHEGIPVALSDNEYSQLIGTLKREGGVVVDCSATIRTLPSREWRMWRTHNVPAVFAFIEDLEVRHRIPRTLVTVSIMFPSGYHASSQNDRTVNLSGCKTRYEKSWSYASYSPTDGRDGLKNSVDWLQEYASRYSGMDAPPIFCDFDEQYSHFELPIEFQLADAASGSLDAQRLLAYAGHYGVQISKVEVKHMSVFDQRGQHVTYQYNAAGNINLHSVSNRAEFAEELSKLETEVGRAKETNAMSEEMAADVEHQLRKARIEAKKPDADKPTVLEYLRKAKTLIEGVVAAGGLVTAISKAAEVAQKVF